MAHDLTIRTNGKVEMAYVGETPWHGLGQELEPGAAIEDWIVAAGMDLSAVIIQKSSNRRQIADHPNRNRRFYAAQSPRGFANEIEVHVFTSRKDRNTWVAVHLDDGDCNSASQGAIAVTSNSARKIINYRGDATTQSYNSVIEHYVKEAKNDLG